MKRTSCFLIFLVGLIGLSAIPSAAQSGITVAPMQISGAVQSFSGNTLDIKPAASPAVWVMIPDDLRVDRAALKPGTEVSIEAHWTDVCYIASQVTIKK